jgi:hypothetical protein
MGSWDGRGNLHGSMGCLSKESRGLRAENHRGWRDTRVWEWPGERTGSSCSLLASLRPWTTVLSLERAFLQTEAGARAVLAPLVAVLLWCGPCFPSAENEYKDGSAPAVERLTVTAQNCLVLWPGAQGCLEPTRSPRLWKTQDLPPRWIAAQAWS